MQTLTLEPRKPISSSSHFISRLATRVRDSLILAHQHKEHENIVLESMPSLALRFEQLNVTSLSSKRKTSVNIVAPKKKRQVQFDEQILVHLFNVDNDQERETIVRAI